ncbi:hypothetical protein TWF730_003316 [Orbilia blumenaviensis]|uniref:Uncharacterized protein n=1 Tax=Orbilia blumenaviensis TaxID=1796055 RepID=A0AAV9U5A4_9PEZI
MANTVRYSSACACIGIFQTAPPVTVTTTKTVSETGIATAVATSFHIKVSGGETDRYIDYGAGNFEFLLTTNVIQATIFHLDADNVLESDVGRPAPSGEGTASFVPLSVDSISFLFYTCTISSTYALSCVSETQGDGNYVSFGLHTFEGQNYIITGKEGKSWAESGQDGVLASEVQLEAVPIIQTC